MHGWGPKLQQQQHLWCGRHEEVQNLQVWVAGPCQPLRLAIMVDDLGVAIAAQTKQHSSVLMHLLLRVLEVGCCQPQEGGRREEAIRASLHQSPTSLL